MNEIENKIIEYSGELWKIKYATTLQIAKNAIYYARKDNKSPFEWHEVINNEERGSALVWRLK